MELQFPYDTPAEHLQQALFRNKLTLVLHNLPAGDWAAGERGIACHPDRVEEFRKGVDTALAYAAALGAPQLNCLAGIRPANVPAETARRVLVDNLRFAATKLKAQGLKLLIEPINTHDLPGFFVDGTRLALDLIAEVGADNLFLQYDVYHMQRMGDSPHARRQPGKNRAHPDRRQPRPPRAGHEINFDFLFAHLDPHRL